MMRIEDYRQLSFGRKLMIGILIFFLVVFCFFAFKIGTIVTVIHVGDKDSSLSSENSGAILPLSKNKEVAFPEKKSFWEKVVNLFSQSKEKYKKDSKRMDILVLGIRGEDDPYGGLLTDMILVASYKKDTDQLALISIPRDLYVYIADAGKQERLNYAYSYGESREHDGGGLKISKKIVSQIIGLEIDYAVSIDFRAFQEIVDTLGGITIYREKPFLEDLQWQGEGKESSPFWYKKIITDKKTEKEKEVWALHIPAGQITLDGNAALYYVRSRYTTSDFDRSRRQQEVLLSLKDKAFSLGVLANPFKISEILNSLKRHLRTDISPEQIFDFIELAYNSKVNSVKRWGLDTTPSGLLYESHLQDGSYVLFPVGNNFDKIREACRNIFQ